MPEQARVYGKAYAVPEAKIFLNDEEIGGPFAEREVTIKYYWGWDIIRRTVETDRFPYLQSLAIKRRTDVIGIGFFPHYWSLRPDRRLRLGLTYRIQMQGTRVLP